MNYFQTVLYSFHCLCAWPLTSIHLANHHGHCTHWPLLCVFFLFIVGYKKKFMLKIFVLFEILHHFIARIKAKTVFNVHEERNNTIQYRSKRLIESVIVLVCLGHKFSTIKIEQCFLKHKWKIHCIKCPPLKFCLWNYNNINKLHFGGAGVKLSFLYQEYRRKRKVRKW